MSKTEWLVLLAFALAFLMVFWLTFMTDKDNVYKIEYRQVTPTVEPLPTNDIEREPDYEALRVFFERRNPDMVGRVHDLLVIADHFDADVRVLVAVGSLESANFRSNACVGGYNCFGHVWGSTLIRYESWTEGFVNAAKLLRGVGYDDLAQANTWYAADPNWHSKVRTIYNEI